MRKQRGFSLIELLIVVGIILILAAIALPNLLRARISANEASAVGSLRTIDSAQITFAMSFPGNGYAVGLTELGTGSTGICPLMPTSAGACILDNVLGCPTATCLKDGFHFTVTPDLSVFPTVFYHSSANPVSAQTGTRCFYSDVTGVIRYNATNVATVTDAALQ